MNQRTTIGGTVYESVGSNTSNLLLRCNGTARIQWGNKLIDLIKNGKLAVENSSAQVSIIKDESEIKQDGLYVINNDKSSKLFVCKNGERYDITGSDLYISASTKQDFTVEQKKQAQENLGMYYNTLKDLENAGIQDGVAYVLEDTSLYTIQNGSIKEFEAKLKTVTVEKENEEGEIIKSSYKIVLNVLDSDYIVLEDQKIFCKQDIVVNKNSQIYSEGASVDSGYKLYMDNQQSYLEVDNLNVRNGLQIEEYITVSYDTLQSYIDQGTLKPNQWYVIEDYKNPWNLHVDRFVPILVRAFDQSTLYDYGYLYKYRDVAIKYDLSFKHTLLINDSSISTRGLITWMKDSYNNEANFDFLDYVTHTDSNGNSVTTSHTSELYLQSLFPTGSYNNKVTVSDLLGIKINDGVLDTNACVVDFQFQEFGGINMIMHDNILSCSGSGLQLSSKCTEFYNNVFGIIDNSKAIDANIHDCKFMDIKDCTFGEGTLTNVISRSNLSNQTFASSSNVLLYDVTKSKDIYLNGSTLNITSIGEQLFYRGMIVMHSGIQPIPEGWAVCDGKSYTFNGVSSVTPNLVGRFIKATDSSGNVKAVDINTNNSVTLTKENLPSHSHPHQSHTHNISLTGSGTVNTCTNTTPTNAVIAVDGGTLGYSGDKVSVQSVGVNMSISGTSQAATSTETTQSWENTPFSIEPNYYSLIFIMKL